MKGKPHPHGYYPKIAQRLNQRKGNGRNGKNMSRLKIEEYEILFWFGEHPAFLFNELIIVRVRYFKNFKYRTKWLKELNWWKGEKTNA